MRRNRFEDCSGEHLLLSLPNQITPAMKAFAPLL